MLHNANTPMPTDGSVPIGYVALSYTTQTLHPPGQAFDLLLLQQGYDKQNTDASLKCCG